MTEFEKKVIAAHYWLLGRAVTEPEYLLVLKAMEFAMNHHTGKRNGGAPEFSHQIDIFHILRTYHHLLKNPVETYILGFLHDVIEDGQKQGNGRKVYIHPHIILQKFGQVIHDKTLALSKEINGVKNPNYSLDAIFNDPSTAAVKLVDRYHNISTMVGVFKHERAERYITETKSEFIPRAKKARKNFPEMEMVFESLKLHMNNQLKLIDSLMGGASDVVQNNGPQDKADQPPLGVKAILSLFKSSIPTSNELNILGDESGNLFIRSKKDMEWFKTQTENTIVVMGRKTFESIAGKPLAECRQMGEVDEPILKGRHVIVLTSLAGKPDGGSDGWFNSYPHFTLVDPAKFEAIFECFDTQHNLVSHFIDCLAKRAIPELQHLMHGEYGPIKAISIAGGASIYEECLRGNVVDVVFCTEFRVSNPDQLWSEVPSDGQSNATDLFMECVLMNKKLVRFDNFSNLTAGFKKRFHGEFSDIGVFKCKPFEGKPAPINAKIYTYTRN